MELSWNRICIHFLECIQCTRSILSIACQINQFAFVICSALVLLEWGQTEGARHYNNNSILRKHLCLRCLKYYSVSLFYACCYELYWTTATIYDNIDCTLSIVLFVWLLFCKQTCFNIEHLTYKCQKKHV